MRADRKDRKFQFSALVFLLLQSVAAGSCSPGRHYNYSHGHSSLSVPQSTPIPTTALNTSETAAPVYGSVVDVFDVTPPMYVPPATLPQREAGVLEVVGDYSKPFVGSLGGTNLLFWKGTYLNITGKGYFQVRWEIAWFNRFGELVPPTWTGLRGRLFHVASGGGRRMDDVHDPKTDPTATWMGPLTSRTTLPVGYQQMWQNEFYYLDGSITLMCNEGWADYNLGYMNRTWKNIVDDINQVPNQLAIKRYGLVRDTGDDSTPVPQYTTNLITFNNSLVTMDSDVTFM